MSRVARAYAVLRAAIDRRGGGWAGVRSAALRAFHIVRALGLRGLAERLRQAQPAPDADADTRVDAADFPAPAPPGELGLRVGVMLHAYYVDLFEEFVRALEAMPVPYTLMVSVVDERAREIVLARCATLPRVTTLHVRVVENRGRDLAPFFVTFRAEILALDVVCHLHTKKSLYSGREQGAWRHHLVGSLLGGSARIAWILGMFQAMPGLGMVYPETWEGLPWWAHTWLGNAACGRALGARLGVAVDTQAYFDFPAGSMFWARVSALQPLFALHLATDAFPPESGQADGTLQHALERMLGLVVRGRGRVLGILPADGTLALRSEGERNWRRYFTASLERKVAHAAVGADITSFDVFDTLVTRPFLSASGARAYLAHRAQKRQGIADYAALRERAETAARLARGREPDHAAILAAMAGLPGVDAAAVAGLAALELETEARLLRVRPAALAAATALHRSGMRVIAVSDMYFGPAELAHVLPADARGVLDAVHVSSTTGWRKDTGEAWRELPRVEHVPPARWLHVGDNEHADVQWPQSLGYIGPVHVLRPGALLDFVPALRGLRPSPAQRARWQDQLWLGLVANHLATLADTRPEAFGRALEIEAPESLGYLVLGPLVLDYATWLARLAREQAARRILFLSREGHLLRQVFARLQRADAGLAALDADYLPVSRRAVNTSSLRDIGDLAGVFAAPYTGPLEGLLRTRLGARAAAAAIAELGPAAAASEVFLPEMATRITDRLRPAAQALLRIAAEEREAYLAYWNGLVRAGDRPIVADIGYAGSIQRGLAAFTGAALGGAYFAVTRGIEAATLHGSWAEARFHDARSADAATHPVLEQHLFLEALLTAPSGQFSHFELDARGPQPVYEADDAEPSAHALLERIHEGALAFVADACAAVDDDITDVACDPLLVQEPLRCIGNRSWRLGAWAAALRVEDRYTGRGNVDAQGA